FKAADGRRKVIVMPDLVRQPAGEKQAEKNTEGVNVRCGFGRLALELLGTGERYGKRTLISSGHKGSALRQEKLGDAEVEELRLSACGDKDVARLDVAVGDKLPVRVGNGGAHLEKHVEAEIERRSVLLTVGCD